MMRRTLVLIAFFFLFSCTINEFENNTIVLNYNDFGPQVISNHVLGMGWWQWQNHGASRPKLYDIKVVVYRNIELHKIKKTYPIDPIAKKDYRYFRYSDAIKYLNKHIKDNVMEELTKQLKRTKKKITSHLGTN
ncbi:MAG: hypothetical protein ACC657_16405 [Thiohalomonadales bacterium]